MPDDPQLRKPRPWLPVALIAGSIGLGWLLLKSGPTVTPVEEDRPAKIVKTRIVAPADHAVSVTAYGTVIPSLRVTVEPEVTGNIIRLHPQLLPGGLVEAGEELFIIDSTLVELDLRETRAGEVRARASFGEAERRWNEGRQLAAERVIADTELASLESNMRIAEADLERILASKARTEELLKRHTVTAPFNALVLRESVEVGQRVSPGDATVTLVGTDAFHVQASLPVDQLRWVRFPSGTAPGATADVVVDTGDQTSEAYDGEVVQLLGDIEELGRMAKILIEVKDPMNRGASRERPPLLLGSYVRVNIDAGVLDNVLAIDRTALRENNTVWVVDTNGRLQIRDARIRWRREDTILIDPVLDRGEQLVTSTLRVALPDMEVRAEPENPAAEQIVANAPES